MALHSSTLGSLRFFEAAARLSSFKRAAIELHVTQGAVSQHIKQLEQALRCKLFYRLPQRIVLTQEGRQLAVVVSQALQDIERTAKAIAAPHAAVEIRVRVGPSFALQWLVPRLGDFYARFPDIKLFVSAAYGYFDPARREFDLAIEMIKETPSGVHSERLMHEYVVPVCSPRYMATHPFLRRPEDLARCTLLHDSHAWAGGSEDAEWRHWLTQVNAAEVDSAQGRFFTLANMSIEAALTDQGVAMGRATLICDLLESGQLVTPFERRIESPASHFLVYHSEAALRPAMQKAIRWLHERAQDFRRADSSEGQET